MVRSRYIDYDFKNSPLKIETDSEYQSRTPDEMALYFYHPTAPNSQTLAGGIKIKLGSPPQYLIGYCRLQYARFTDELPTKAEKIWEITKTLGLRLIIHCNRKKVLDIQISDSLCKSYNYWEYYWSKDVKRIIFSYLDTASDYYFHQLGKYWDDNCSRE